LTRGTAGTQSVIVTDGTSQVVTIFEYKNIFGFVGIRAAVDGARVARSG